MSPGAGGSRRKLEPPAARLAAQPAVRAVREALAVDAESRGEDVWIVGGAVRDAMLGRPVHDVDLAVAGDPEPAARAVAKVAGGPAFPLSEQFGAWRAVARGGHWVCDVSPLAGASIEDDLARRDFTANAMAILLTGGEPVDPFGGARDLEAGILRVLGEGAYAADPVRPLRLARLAAELRLRPDPETERLTSAAAARTAEASGERQFAELRRLVLADGVVEGIELAGGTGVLAAVLPELDALHGVEQSHFHHLDVYGHTLEVLRQQLWLDPRLEELFGEELGERVRKLLGEPLADELTRGEALRFGALLHDIGKPATRGVNPDGRVTFLGHDALGEEMVGAICRRLRTSDRLRANVAGLTRHHLALGFLVQHRPLSRRALYGYLTGCRPVEVEVTVLSCADRLATRGRNAERAIEAHLGLAREVLPAALDWREQGPPRPPVRGDELAAELGIEPGPRLGRLLAGLEEACFTGEVRTREQAIERARELLG